jgi:AcrR family transcriptional regulator
MVGGVSPRLVLAWAGRIEALRDLPVRTREALSALVFLALNVKTLVLLAVLDSGVTRQERRDRERAQRRQVIVNAARELAEAEGWESVTTRRLADCIEYSQPVLYSHFEGKDAIVSAVALEGFGELAAVLHNARERAGSPDAEPRAVASAYLEFARANPALYEAMFTLSIDLTFAGSDTPAPVHAGFVELRKTLAPLAGDRDAETFTEIAWSGLHGLATLSQASRLRPAFYDQRLAMLVDQLATARA